MKSQHVVSLVVFAIFCVLIAGCSGSSTDDKAAEQKTTGFQGHSEGKYGPEGAGGYGSPVVEKGGEEAREIKESGEEEGMIQDVREGTGFQDHSEGKYGPPGAGGYGSPVPGAQTDAK